jgi:hypothetical protein
MDLVRSFLTFYIWVYFKESNYLKRINALKIVWRSNMDDKIWLENIFRLNPYARNIRYYIYRKEFKKMCQCILCDCIWWNYCGACAGCATLECCFGWWCCQQDELKRSIGADTCCWCCQFVGLGSNCLCSGFVCCAQPWLLNYSKALTAKKWLSPTLYSFILFLKFSNPLHSFYITRWGPYSFSKTSSLYQVHPKNNTRKGHFLASNHRNLNNPKMKLIRQKMKKLSIT